MGFLSEDETLRSRFNAQPETCEITRPECTKRGSNSVLEV